MNQKLFNLQKDPARQIINKAKKHFEWFGKANRIGIIPAELVMTEKNPLENLIRWTLQEGFNIGQADGLELAKAQALGADADIRAQFVRFVAFTQCCAIDGEVLTEKTINAFLKAGES
tara:strand:- start:1596 stop:1949 length:354 start_codon:yes stop_codon:yes gene_type:complete